MGGSLSDLQRVLRLIERRPTEVDHKIEASSLDPIKYTLYTEEQYNIFAQVLETDEVSEYFRKFLIYNEYSEFYNTSMKTSILKRVNREISEEIFDVQTKVKGTEITLTELRELDELLRLYGRIGVYKREDGTFEFVEPFRYSHDNNKVTIVYSEDGTTAEIIERELVGHNRLHHSTYILDGDERKKLKKKSFAQKGRNVSTNFVELEAEYAMPDAIFELALFHSEIFTALQKEVYSTTPQLFLDEGYLKGLKPTMKRAAYTPVRKMQATPGDGVKPLFEIYNPDIRDTSYQNALDMIEGKIANLLGIDKATITGNATEGTLQNDKSAKTINSYKRAAETVINAYLENHGGSIELMSYSLQSREAIIKNAVLLVNNGIGNNMVTLQELYPTLSKKELEIMYLKTEIKAGRPLTLDEEELAIKYGLQEEEPEIEEQPLDEEGNPIPQEEDSEEGSVGNNDTTTEKQIENTDKVNTQGVATAADKI